MKLELAKELYQEEWERRDQLAGSVSTPIGIVTALAGGVALMINSFEFTTSFATHVFAGAVANAVLFLLAAAYFVARSYHGYEYQAIPSASQLEDHCLALHEYHAAAGNDPSEADSDFDKYLAARFIEAAEVNAANNVSKSAYLYRATQAIIVSLVTAAIAVAPWASLKLRELPSPQIVSLRQPLEVRVIDNDRTKSARNAANTGNAATQSPAASGGSSKSARKGG